MAGVPTSTGCDACRKQKKKCVQGKPACSRCTRLGIPCVGSGTIRYQFKDHFSQREKGNKTPSASGPCGPKISSTSSLTERQRERRSSPSQGPGSSQSLTRSGAFAFLLEVKDPRYDVTSYGVFLTDLPRRIGFNEALDAAVDVVVDSYSYLRTKQSPKGSLARYVHALQALQRCLNDREKARDLATLCAIYLIMICQGWTGMDRDQKTTHGEGLAYLLDATISRSNLDDFETLLRDTLCVPVLLESLYRPKLRHSRSYIELKRRARGSAQAPGGENGPLVKGSFAYLIDIADFLNDPARNFDSIPKTYEQIRREMPEQKQALDQMDELISRNGAKDPSMSPYALAKLHIQHQILWALLLLPALICNSLLRALGAHDLGSLEQEAAGMVDDAVALAVSAGRYRPFGSGFVPMCLIAAWAATEDAAGRTGVERALDVYRNDFSDETARAWQVLATCLRAVLISCAGPDSTAASHGLAKVC